MKHGDLILLGPHENPHPQHTRMRGREQPSSPHCTTETHSGVQMTAVMQHSTQMTAPTSCGSVSARGTLRCTTPRQQEGPHGAASCQEAAAFGMPRSKGGTLRASAPSQPSPGTPNT